MYLYISWNNNVYPTTTILNNIFECISYNKNNVYHGTTLLLNLNVYLSYFTTTLFRNYHEIQ